MSRPRIDPWHAITAIMVLAVLALFIAPWFVR